MANDRFDLEQAIMACWSTADDLDLLADAVLNEELDTDGISDALLGLQRLHVLRAKKVFDIFEAMIESQQIT